MDYSSYMETTIFRTAAMLGFRRLQSYMLPCLYALLYYIHKFFMHCAKHKYAKPAMKTLNTVISPEWCIQCQAL